MVIDKKPLIILNFYKEGNAILERSDIMEKISIEVNEKLAQRWRQVESQEKQKISRDIERILEIAMGKNEEDLWPFLENIRLEAERKGFNDQVLDEILNE